MGAPYDRAAYEGNGGWKDGRLGQAYDLIDAVRRDHPSESGLHEDMKPILALIESADIDLGIL